jgi:hypothetical protein
VLLLNECLLLLFISLSTKSGNFWIYPRTLHFECTYEVPGFLSMFYPELPERFPECVAHMGETRNEYTILYNKLPFCKISSILASNKVENFSVDSQHQI